MAELYAGDPPASGGQPPTVAALAQMWLDWTAANLAHSTWRTRRVYLGWLLEFYGLVPASKLTPLDIERVKAAHKGNAPRSVNHFVTVAKGLYRWGLRHGVVEVNPIQYVQGVRNVAQERRDMPQELVEAAFAAGDAMPPLGDFMRFLYYTGLRLGEATTLQWRDYDLKAQAVRLLRHKTVAHSGQARLVPLSEPAAKVIASLTTAVSSGLIFNISQNAAQGRLKRLKQRFPGLQGVTFHRFRHTFASRARAAGADMSHLQQVLGHSSTLMTLYYAAPELERLREVAELVK